MNLTDPLTTSFFVSINSSSLSDVNSTSPWNRSCDGLGTVEERRTLVQHLLIYRPTAVAIDKFVTPLWYAVGFPGNMLAFLVWIQVRMRPSSGCYLAALALNDFIFLMLHIFFELQNIWDIDTLYLPGWCEIFPILYISAQHLSPLLVLGFTVERYISICHPFQREKFCNTKRALIVIAFLVSFCYAVNLIQGYFWSFQKDECSVRDEALEHGTRSLWSVWSWVTELLVFGVVPIAILILNILVIKEARRLSDREESLMHQYRGHKTSGQSATTLTLLVVSFYLIFSTLPVTVCYAMVSTFPPGDDCTSDEELYTDEKWQNHFSYWYARNIIQELGMSHFVLNFYIYLLTGKAFRRELQLLLLKVFCKSSFRRWLHSNGTELTELNMSKSQFPPTNGEKENSKELDGSP